MSFAPPAFPLPVRLGLTAWQGVERFGIGRVALDEASLLKAARRSAGGRDFEDHSFLDPMRRMLWSLEAEANLHLLGRATLRESLVRALANRLRFEALVEKNPDIGNVPITEPVFVVGLQRTGTTMLHRLLTCEPKLRAMPAWEGLNPAPLAKPTDRRGRDSRIRLAEFAESAARYLAPELFAIHPVEADAPEEDIHLLDITFVSPAIDAILHVPTYHAWFRETDQLPAYQYMRRLVQLLLWQRYGRWLGKTPHHMEYLDELFAVFPDAKVILTHRDPTRTVASFCSMMAHSRAMFCSQVDAVEVGEQFSAKAIRAVDRLLASRDRMGDAAFLDVQYQDLLADPMKEVRRVYDFIGLELEPDTEAEMDRWRDENRQTKHGVHQYRLDEFGLDRGELAPRFRAYRERFGVEEER